MGRLRLFFFNLKNKVPRWKDVNARCSQESTERAERKSARGNNLENSLKLIGFQSYVDIALWSLPLQEFTGCAFPFTPTG